MKKEIIISFILGEIISSVVGVIAANTISSSSVIYKDDKTLNTVLDELFENVDAIESDNTRLTSLEGKVNTLSSTHSSDIARIDNNITNHTTQINNVTESLNNKANSSHKHDDRYYTETEMNSKINSLNKSINNINIVKYDEVSITIPSGSIFEVVTIPSDRTILSVSMVYTYSLYLKQMIAIKHIDGNKVGVISADGQSYHEDAVYKVRYAYY